jgi:hypothetical protein
MVPGMIDKDYFRRQARTLRKMMKVAQDKMVADRLGDMADDFDNRAKQGAARPDRRFMARRRPRAGPRIGARTKRSAAAIGSQRRNHERCLSRQRFTCSTRGLVMSRAQAAPLWNSGRW